MKGKRWYGVVPAVCALAAGAASAADLDFNFKINQGPIDTTFAMLSVQELVAGTTTFSLDTALSGGQGNPGIVELRFGCNGCASNVTFTPISPGVTIQPDGVQAGYNFDFVAKFDPEAIASNTPLMFTATGSANAFLESTSGAGPNALALIQLTGGAETVFGENVTSGFYVAVADGAAPIPEPSTYALMLTGIAVVGFAINRKRKKLGKHSVMLA